MEQVLMTLLRAWVCINIIFLLLLIPPGAVGQYTESIKKGIRVWHLVLIAPLIIYFLLRVLNLKITGRND